jgi:putative DNA primase/helicase
VPIGGDIAATRANWDGIIEGTAKDILGEVETDDDGDGDARDDLERMLRDTIRDAGGMMPAKALQAEVRDAGHSWNAAKRLKKSMGIEAKKLGMGSTWVWCLPGSP